MKKAGGLKVMSEIRLRYAGFVSFGVYLLSLFTGALFTIIVARRLTLDEFGAWQYISRLISFALLPSSIVNFWVVRDIARGKYVLRTGVIVNVLLAFIASLAYVVVSFPAARSIEVPLAIMFLASIQIPVSYILGCMEAATKGYKPQHASYAFMISEVSKVFFGFILVAMLRLGLAGTILAVSIAMLSQTTMLAYVTHKKLIGGFDAAAAKGWLKGSVIPASSALVGMISGLDIFLVSAYYSATPLAYWGAAVTIGSIVGYSGQLATALYPKLLIGGRSTDIETAINMVMMLGFPMALGAAVMAKPLLNILGPNYPVAAPVLWLMIPSSLLTALSWTFDAVLTGTEKVDLMPSATLKDYMGSKLFLVSKLECFKNLIYISLVAVFLYLSQILGLDYLGVAVGWTAISTLTITSFSIYKGFLARKLINFNLSFAVIKRYAVASITMILALILLGAEKILIPTVYVQVPAVLSAIVFGVAVYFLVLYAIDPEFRKLLSEVWRTFSR